MRREFQSWIAKISLVVALVVSPSVVLAQEVSTNSMPGTDFSKYHTYKWVTIASGGAPNQIVDAEITQAIDSQLAAKGLTKTASDQANLFVVYQAAIGQQKQWSAYDVDWTTYMYGTNSTIDVGTIVLDMYDPAAKQLVWTGRVTKTLDPSASQEKKQEHLDNAMEKLLKDFPPHKR
jgi:hypothetical protein